MKYANVPIQPTLAGAFRLALAMAPSMGVSAAAGGSRLSAYAGALEFAVDTASGLYTIAGPGGSLLTADGRAAALRAADGSGSQIWELRAAEGGYVIRSASSGMVLDSRRAGTAEGNEVRLEWANGTAAQVWELDEPIALNLPRFH